MGGARPDSSDGRAGAGVARTQIHPAVRRAGARAPTFAERRGNAQLRVLNECHRAASSHQILISSSVVRHHVRVDGRGFLRSIWTQNVLHQIERGRRAGVHDFLHMRMHGTAQRRPHFTLAWVGTHTVKILKYCLPGLAGRSLLKAVSRAAVFCNIWVNECGGYVRTYPPRPTLRERRRFCSN